MASLLARSLEVPVAVGGLSQVGHPHEDEALTSSEGEEINDSPHVHTRQPVTEDGGLPVLVAPTDSEHRDSGIHHDGVVIEEDKLSLTRVEEFPTLERGSSGNTSVSQFQRQQSQPNSHSRSQQQFEHSSPPQVLSDASIEPTNGQSISRCGSMLLPTGFTYRREQLLLGVSVLSVSLALGACALYFRDGVGAATNMNSGLVFGSAGSLAMCSVVIGAYMSIKWYRRHMHTLLVNLALCEFFLALSFALEPAWHHLGAGAGEGLTCRWLSTVREYLIMCSSAWTTCTALDLYYLMTNPFTSPRINRRKYQFIAHGVATTSAVIMALSDSFDAPVAVGDFCWVGGHTPVRTANVTASTSTDEPASNSAGIWLFVVAPAAVTLGVNSYVSFISFARFRGGIAATLRSRQPLLREGFLTTVTLALYSALLWGIYGGYWLTSSTADTRQDPGDDNGQTCRELLAHAFAFLLSYRGSVPFVLWCLYRRPSTATKAVEGGNPRLRSFWASKSDRKRPSAAVIDAATAYTAATSTRATASELSEAEEGDDDAVRPQMNRALLEELVYFTTQGIAVAVRAASVDGDSNDAARTFTLTPTSSSTGDSSTWSTDVACKFTDFRPVAFQRVRQVFRIDDGAFLQSLAACSTPKVSEGASGAFMFYSTDRSFIVKSLSSHESGFLHSFLDRYLAHVSTHRDTFLTRFLGSYCLVLYGRKAHFVVMENVFDVQHGISIHQRYDIKGSWIDRNAQKPRRGSEATCRHCNLTFRYGVGRNVCPNRAGTSHEPNVVLKDMDLTTKLRFGKKQGRLLLLQLKRDSDFLCEQGIMDYSLLLGVIEVSYQVSQHNVLTRDGSVFLQNILESASAEQEREAGGEDAGDASGPRVKQSTRCLRASEVVIGPGFYYIGIIDILQTWSVAKRVERFVKTALLRSDPDGISAMPPRAYRDRFHRKLHEIIHLGHNSIAVPSTAAPDCEPQQQAVDGTAGDHAGNGGTGRMSVDRSTAIRPMGVPTYWPPDARSSDDD